MTVHYQSLCPFSRQLINTHLLGMEDELHDGEVELEFVPHGHSQVNLINQYIHMYV